MTHIPFARALVEAQERYYMANGQYGRQIDLDIEMPGECQFVNGSEIKCGTDWVYDNVTLGIPIGYLVVSYCPGANAQGSTSCYTKTLTALSFYYKNHATDPGKFVCYSSKGNKICQTFTELFGK